jgi:hypothetical protein
MTVEVAFSSVLSHENAGSQEEMNQLRCQILLQHIVRMVRRCRRKRLPQKWPVEVSVSIPNMSHRKCVIALALLRCLLEGVQWLLDPSTEWSRRQIRHFAGHEAGCVRSRSGDCMRQWWPRLPNRRPRDPATDNGGW